MVKMRGHAAFGGFCPPLYGAFFVKGFLSAVAITCEVGVVGDMRADQAGAARPGRCDSKLCANGERRHPQGRSAAEQPAPAGLTTLAVRATGSR